LQNGRVIGVSNQRRSACNDLEYRCKDCIKGKLGRTTIGDVGWKQFRKYKTVYPEFCSQD
jgi:hypothetical protein